MIASRATPPAGLRHRFHPGWTVRRFAGRLHGWRPRGREAVHGNGATGSPVGEWRNGRRWGLKIPCPKGRAGSIPASPSCLVVWWRHAFAMPALYPIQEGCFHLAGVAAEKLALRVSRLDAFRADWWLRIFWVSSTRLTGFVL